MEVSERRQKGWQSDEMRLRGELAQVQAVASRYFNVKVARYARWMEGLGPAATGGAGGAPGPKTPHACTILGLLSVQYKLFSGLNLSLPATHAITSVLHTPLVCNSTELEQ